MADCGIMRVEKRDINAVGGIQREANRSPEDHYERSIEFNNSDIDWTRTKENIHIVRTENWRKEIYKQIADAGLTARSNSKVLIDGLFTASPEWFKNHDREAWILYFENCLDFYVDTYCCGDRSRLINAVIHLDETTPHMQVASVPIFKDEKGYHLSAKDICGNRTQYREYQNNFWKKVSKQWGLERGEVREFGQTKKHKETAEFRKETIEKEIKEKILEQEIQKTATEVELAKLESITSVLQSTKTPEGKKTALGRITYTKEENEVLQKKAALYDAIPAAVEEFREEMSSNIAYNVHQTNKRLKDENAKLKSEAEHYKNLYTRELDTIDHLKQRIRKIVNAVANIFKRLIPEKQRRQEIYRDLAEETETPEWRKTETPELEEEMARERTLIP